jgi:hypothetical protein
MMCLWPDHDLSLARGSRHTGYMRCYVLVAAVAIQGSELLDY